jgi:hypothetical protein
VRSAVVVLPVAGAFVGEVPVAVVQALVRLAHFVLPLRFP